ncbi:MAG: M23 family metallopeptidase [Bacteroidales bacterium]|nr:M23 family metallopeptidase [Bacteroidales bacterium]
MRRFEYNPETLSYEEQQLTGWRSVLLTVVIAAGAVAVVAAFYWLWFVALGNDLPKTVLLKRKVDRWQAEMGVVRHKLDVYENTLAGIEARDNDVYRSIFGLDALADTARRDTALNDIQALDYRMDAIQRRIDLRMSGLGEVALVAKKAGDMVSCIPAVPPLLPKKGTYHLSSPFGVRSDPVYGGSARHTGQDFATKIGNPVYATGDGLVEKVDFKYSGYGNEVVIDHGFGYKTRYAHLNTIDVGVGQSLKRGDKIGEVGKSGKSTGPHLHYEVIYRGNAVNPMSFMDMDMPVDEYRAMIGKRKLENSTGSRPSTAAMGRRQKRQGTNGRK